MSSARRLLAGLRETMARGTAPLGELVRLVASELVAEVCSVYAMRPGDILELVATVGLRPGAVGRTRLRVGEGIIGLAAATGEPLNLPDAQNHPAFAYRPETGEEPYASLLAIPVRRAGRTVGVLSVQNRAPRLYAEDEVELLATVAMLLAEVLVAAGATGGAEEGVSATLPRQFEGAGLAPGLAIGPVVLRRVTPHARRLLAEDADTERGRLRRAAETMREGLDALIERAPEGGASRDVLDATRLLAADVGWLHRVSEAIGSGLTAEAAVQRVAGELRERMRHIADPYLRERLADIEDLANRLLEALDGDTVVLPDVPPGAILLARRLGPAQLLDWHGRGIVGVVIEEGGPNGHAAILARALGLPALGAARGAVDVAETGDEAVLDADEGLLILRPEAELCQAYRRALEAREARAAGWAALRDQPARTADGVPLQLMLNVGLRMELDQIAATGADGIGLFRTEIAMLARGSVADIAEQASLYADVLDRLDGRPVLFRTLDLGGDKLLPGAPLPEEENPAMGWRSLRVGLDRPKLLRRQMRALLLGARGRPLSVMFPMVATVAEFRAARALLLAEAAQADPAPAQLQIGTMLEVPSLLWQLEALLAETDFVSIGSSDLMQFVFAADRGNAALAQRYDLLSAPMLDLLEQVRFAAVAAAVPLSLCGAAAAHGLDALVLAALGITSLSMPATAFLPVKAALAAVDLGGFRAVLRALRQTGAAEPSLREPLLAWCRERDVPV
jgi:phosphotransferase system enzyme I (PtsP)